MSTVHELIASLSPAKRAVLVARNPLSFGQERLWLVAQLAPGSVAYNIALVLSVEGVLDLPAFLASIDEIVRRHEVLRTTFAAPDGAPMQVVHPPARLAVPVADLRPLGEEERWSEVRRWTTAEARRPFDLVAGPLVRCGLLRLAPEEHVFYVNLHHIVADGWSIDVLIGELVAIYGAFSGGRPSPLPELPVQYLDFARWQREWLAGEVLETQLSYWMGQLAGAPQVLELPSDHPRPRERTYRSARRTLLLPPSLSEDLRRLAQRLDATLFTCLLSAFMAQLARLTGQDDLIVGSPVAGRSRSEVEPLIGFFLNLLALRGDLSGDPTFAELVDRMREVVLAGQSHQDIPFERLVAELQPERDLGRAPLAQVVLVLLIRPQKLELPGIALKTVEVEVGASQYDLALSMMQSSQGLAARLEYSTELFEESTAVRLLDQLHTLLAGVVSDPGRRLSGLPLLSEAERGQLLGEWGRGEAPAAPRCLHELLRERVAVSAEAVAVSFGAEHLTYRELGLRAGRVAARLRAAGVGPDTVVALSLERSLAMVAGLWGVLEAGGAYLPLDPGHPRKRRAWILADSGAPVVVTQEPLAAELTVSGARVIRLDDRGAPIGEGATGELPAEAADPESLAYVIYTSGSTGRPKGVQIPHRAVSTFLGFMGERIGLGAGDTLLAVTTLSFDISVLELALPLLRGARVALATSEEAADGVLLAEALERTAATVMQATPATWQMLLQSGWRGGEGLTVLCGGEAMPAELARQALERAPEVWNLYGPTETTIWSTVERLTAGTDGPVPIGRPIAGTEVSVLGRRLELQPAGVPGELHIGGAGLSRGYSGRPGLTAERFIPGAFGPPGARVYKTGDLARFRPDGALEFLGRIDHQVKVRGFRIELAEVEATLAAHPGVRDAVAVVREDSPGDRRLVAYFVAAEGAGPSTAELRTHLAERLPAYMVPAALVPLAALPLNPNGKVDRRALPAPEGGEPADRYVAPRTPAEEELAAIWQEVLGLERVGVDASFFELGGHSLLATSLMHRVRTAFQVQLPLAALFERPTVAGLAAAVARQRAERAGDGLAAAELPPIVTDPVSRYEPFPLNDVQQAYWIGRGGFLELGNVSSHSYTEIDLADLDVRRLEQALDRLVARHDMLRAVILPDGRQRVLPAVPPYRIAVVDVGGLAPRRADAALLAIRAGMSHQVLPADRWPLFDVRATLLPGGRFRLHFSLDYLVADAWSTGIIFREVFAFYQDPGLEPPPLELSFRDCVLAEVALQGSEAHRRAEEHWRRRIATLPGPPELPLARSPESLDRPRFVRRSARLDPEAWTRLRQAGARAGLTPSGLLLAAFAEVLALWSKSPRFTINLTLFNRPARHPEIADVVGDFTSLTLLGVDGSLADTFELRARALQERLWQDLEHRSVSAVAVMRELARTQGQLAATVMPVVFTSILGLQDRAARAEAEEPVFGISQTPQVWLDHQVLERGGALLFNWDAVEDLFPPGLLDDMFGAYRRLLDRLSEPEAWRQAGRPRLPAAQAELRAAVNATEAPVPEGLLHTLVRRQAARTPDRPAVLAPGRTLSYGELAARAAVLGRRLRELGARPNRLIAVVMEKGWEQAVAVLGILESGAAYLPVDPDFPTERIHHLLERGEVEVAVTQPRIDARLEWPAGVARVRVEPAAPAAEVPELEVVQGPEDLAYVIFTSGSTGSPKGVMIDHRGAVNTVVDVDTRFAVTADDRVLALSSLGFDLSVYDLFGPLAVGGAVVFPAAASALDPAHWQTVLDDQRVTVWNSVPALMELLVQGSADRGGAARGLRLALLSGDWIPVTLPGRIRTAFPGCRVIGLGGATEASIWSILRPVDEVDPTWPSIPYGRPMVNQRFHVLNEMLEPCPVWVPGQLYIAGIGLAKGYWRDPERTAASFSIHPATGERLYRTGDLGRYLPEGEIEFLGREDLQVKIQGYRIELGEIEAALEQHPAVGGAAVIAVGDPRAGRRLAAFVVPQGDGAGAQELRDFLRTKLPEYMVPATVAKVEALPLTANGKVDRRTLAALASAAPAGPDTAAGGAPRTPLEERIAALWAEVLGVERVSLDDGFFELGGNSLLAIRLIARLRDALQVEVPLRQLLHTGTVAGLAALVLQLRQDRARQEAASLERFTIVPDAAGRHQPFPLNDVQHAYWIGRGQFLELGNVAAHGYAELEGEDLDLDRLAAVLRVLIARHDMLRAVVLPDGRQRILPEVPPYEIAVEDLRDAAPGEVEDRLAAVRRRMSHQVRPTEVWPLFELSASLLPGGRMRLHVSVDILIVDAWSTRLLAGELAALYRDPAALLPPLELSFRDYVLAEAAFRDSEPYRRSREYWARRASTLPAAPELPMVKTPGEVAQPRFVRRAATLDAERWTRLKERAQRSGLTPSGVLLAAFADVLAVWSKSPIFTLNLTTFNRLPLHPQVDAIVGDFTSLTLVAVEGAPRGSFEARARALQEQLWEDLEHRHMSGVAVLREVARNLRRGPAALTPVVFTSTLFESTTAAPTAAGGGPRLKSVYSVSQTPQVWLDHQVGERAGALAFTWDVVEELFPEGLFEDLFAAYVGLLDGLAGSEESWSEAGRPWLPPGQRAQRQAVNATAAPVPAGLLHEPFEARARLAPDRVAVIAGDRALTYGELDRRSRRLAVRLRELGALPGRLVAVVMEKGWEQVAAVLAVLRSGAAYLPVDPALPEERLGYLLRQGEVSLALTQPGLEARLAWPDGVRCLPVGEASGEGPEPPDLAPVQGPGDLAYVIFTSGSTGQPKGVMIDHRGALNTVIDVNGRFGVTAEDRVLALSALNFDLSVYDVFGLLAAGGTVVMPEPWALRDPARWLELVDRQRVTLWNSVPALVEMLVHFAAGLPAARLEPLRLVMMSGDWIPVTLPDRLRALSGDAELVSLGGATEASIWSILYPIGRVDPSWPSIPYGRPMVNQTFHVLDAALEPRPVWVPGDLYIGGVGLARGYWRDEEKTRASFIDHPVTGERLYRTGDLGRYLPDGDIEFLGREDSQVKIQGHRIELGEIEVALGQSPRVRAAVAAAVGPRNQRRLAAYVVLEPTAPRPASAAPAPAARAGERLRLPAPPEEASRRSPGGAWATGGPLGLSDLGRWLACLVQVRLEDAPLPKYRYPSAGNLYPVQVYLRVEPGAVAGLDAGLYYHDPRGHRLVLMASDLQHGAAGGELPDWPGIELLLVARLAAIAPVYGRLAPDFCLLEAGYMSRLLAEAARASGIALAPLDAAGLHGGRDPSAVGDGHVLVHALRAERGSDGADPRALVSAPVRDAWLRLAAAAADHAKLPEIDRLEHKLREPGLREEESSRPAVALGKPGLDQDLTDLFTYRRTDREFLGEPVPFEDLGALLGGLPRPDAGPGASDVYLHVKEGGVDGLAGGTYRYEPEDHCLVACAPGARLERSIHDAVNRAAFDQAGLSLLLVRSDGGAEREAALLGAGDLGQLLMTEAPARRIGLCPVGSLRFDSVRHLFDLPEGAALIHSFVAGRIPSRRAAAVGPAPHGARPAAAAEVEELRAFLAAKLPEYMVPATIMVLDELPLSANGKVDRGALPSPDRAPLDDELSYVPPSNDVERCFAGLWCELLPLDRVGVEDSFFALGGDSIQAVQFLARAREAGFDLSVRDFFELQTVAALATVARPIAAPAPEPAHAGLESSALAAFPHASLAEDELAQLMAEYADDEDPDE